MVTNYYNYYINSKSKLNRSSNQNFQQPYFWQKTFVIYSIFGVYNNNKIRFLQIKILQNWQKTESFELTRQDVFWSLNNKPEQ